MIPLLLLCFIIGPCNDTVCTCIGTYTSERQDSPNLSHIKEEKIKGDEKLINYKTAAGTEKDF